MDLIITGIKTEAKDVKSFFLQPAGTTPLSYKAGQFLTFIHPVNNRVIRRSYSLSTAPGIQERPAITLKRVPNGIMSRWLIDTARPGDVLHSDNGATGIFTLPDDLQEKQIVWFFAAGIGITPILALIESLLYGTPNHAVLVYSNHSREDAAFYEALCSLGDRFGHRLTIVWLWSDARDMTRARLSKESFPWLLREYLNTDPADALCYVCGPASYMWMVQILLQGAGVPAQQIRRESFIIQTEVPRRLPADKGPHRVVIHAGGKTYSLLNTYPDTILRSARLAGISLPYSCDAGQCGSCTAICSSGKVWMSYNEVLTDKDLSMGRVLTCTGHAVGGDVVLHL